MAEPPAERQLAGLVVVATDDGVGGAEALEELQGSLREE